MRRDRGWAANHTSGNNSASRSIGWVGSRGVHPDHARKDVTDELSRQIAMHSDLSKAILNTVEQVPGYVRMNAMRLMQQQQVQRINNAVRRGAVQGPAMHPWVNQAR